MSGYRGTSWASPNGRLVEVERERDPMIHGLARVTLDGSLIGFVQRLRPSAGAPWVARSPRGDHLPSNGYPNRAAAVDRLVADAEAR